MKYISHVVYAHSKASRSLKTTIPQSIVDLLQIQKTDVLEWTEHKGIVTVRNIGTPTVSYSRKDTVK